jgi:RNA polymerase sigma-70 factor, ECF subfamily
MSFALGFASNPYTPWRNVESDEYLIYAIGARSEDALRELYQRYSRSAFSLARRIMRSDTDAEDVIQEVFVKVWHKALEYAPAKGSVSTWLMTIAHHTTIDALRRRTSRDTVHPEEGELERSPDTRIDVDNTLENVMVTEAMGELTSDERQLIELAYFEGLSHSQLATRTGIPLGTIKSRIRVGLQKLRDSLGEW